MPSGRVLKVLLVAAVSVDMALVTADNLLYYQGNFQFVRHVLLMDTVFPDNPLRARALKAPAWHHAFYAVLIAWEALAGLLTGLGALRLARARRADGPVWERAKRPAEAGLGVALLLWYFAFLVVGGEWFQMWQSPTWNGQGAAFRMFAVQGL